MEIFKPSQIAIATSTAYSHWYPGVRVSPVDTDKTRGDLALDLVRAGSERGYYVVVSTSQNSEAFEKELRHLQDQDSKIIVCEAPRVRAIGRREAFRMALEQPNVKVIVNTEPEKPQIVSEFILDIVGPILREEADIIIPSRNQELFEQTYPKYMYESEVLVNRRYNSLLDFIAVKDPSIHYDWFFGPRAFSTKKVVSQLFLKKYVIDPKRPLNQIGIKKFVNPESWSDAQFFPVVEALWLNSKGIGQY